MNRRLQIIIGVLALALVVLSVLGLAALRVDRAHQFSQLYRVQTFTGTNYVVRLLETTVGRVQTGYVVVVYARFENPNPTEIVLKRDWFVLADHDKDYYLPASGAPLIKLPPSGVLEKEALSYVVGDDAFLGPLALEIGHHYFVLLKTDKPWAGNLKEGRFVTFRSRDW